MKKTFSLIVLIVMLFGIMPDRSHAGGIAGATEPTQLSNHAELIPTALATGVTSISTAATNIKLVVLDPVANVLIGISQMQTANNMINLINGGMQGNSLIVSDPRGYINAKGLNTVKMSISALATQKGPYSDSLISTLQNNFRQQPITTQLQQINQSNIPSIIQRKACVDAELTQLAQQDVAARNGGMIEAAQVTARKQELYNALCTGNPNTDQGLAKTLTKLNTQNPGVGGWDTWLAMTSGDNAYNKSVQVAVAESSEINAVKEAAVKDLDRGKGVASQTNCLKRATTDANGQPYATPDAAPCLKEAVVNPSGLLGDSLSKATNAGMDRLASLEGYGSLFQGLTSIFKLAGGIRSISATINSVAGGGGGGSSGTTNVSSSQTVTSAPTKDLVNDPAQKSQMVNPIYKMFNQELSTLDEIEKIDKQITTSLASYLPRYNAVKQCFAQVAPNDSQALAIFAKRDPLISDAQSKIASDTTNIADARDYIQKSKTTIDASFSSNEIMNVYYAYQQKSDSMPTYQTLSDRKNFLSYDSQMTQDLKSDGDITKLENRCASLNQQYAPTAG